MTSQVTVCVADAATKSVIVVSQNSPEFGYVRLQQVRTVIDEKTQFLKRKVLNTLIHGEVEVLKECGYYAGQTLPGNILIQESFLPFNSKSPERDLKIAGTTGIVCVGRDTDGNVKPIYRRTMYSPSSTVDVTIDHINKEEIKAAYSLEVSNKTIKPNADFDAL
jgi:hypothetical protein